MFSFNFASKMLNTIMGTEENQPPGQGGPGQPGLHGMAGGPTQPGARPMGGGFQPVRPTPQGPGGSPRPGYGPPTFSGPRPTPGARPGPPTFGGPQRMGGPGMPHRFNGPQPAPGAQPPPPGQSQRQPMQQPPGQPQPQQQQQQPPQQPPGQAPLGMRGPSPMPGQGVGMGPMRPRGPSPLPAQQQSHQIPSKPAGAIVPDVDLSHLSAEEREMIESVMAKAQQLEQEGAGPIPPGLNAALVPGGQPNAARMIRPEDPRQGVGVDFGARICPICRQRDMSGRDGMPGQECMECRTMVCKACGGMSPHPETKRPEWTCGNCIKRRRMGPPTTTIGNSAGPLGPQAGLGPRPVGIAAAAQSQPITSQSQTDWDAAARSTGGIIPGLQQQLAGSPQQQLQQQQRWESERESDKIESQEDVEIWKNDVGQSRRLSSEIMPPPLHLTSAELQQQHQLFSQSAELYSEGPDDRIDMMNPVDLDINCSTISTSAYDTMYNTTTVTSTADSFSNDPYPYPPAPAPPSTSSQGAPLLISNDNMNMTMNMNMSTTTAIVPEYLPSTSVEGVSRPPSFAEVMRSRSQSIELEKGIIIDPMSSYMSSSGGSRRASADSYRGSMQQQPAVFNAGSFDSGSNISISAAPPVCIMGVTVSSQSSSLYETSISQSQTIVTNVVPLQQQQQQQPQAPPPQQQQPIPCSSSMPSGSRQQIAQPSIDEKANSLMEELSKLQSAVDSTLKRRQKQQEQAKSKDESEFHHRFTSPPRSRSPSPSPSSPFKDTFNFKTFDSPTSPFRSPSRSDFRSPIESPDSPEVPGVRKAIVLKEHDLDDYKSSSEEESGSGSDEEQQPRKGVLGGIITSDPFYDHSPGEVYTIPEEEDEGGSPTGGDLVTSLNRPGIQGSMTENGSPRRGMGVAGAVLPGGLQPQAIRPQLRPQRSLDNRLPSVSGAGAPLQQDIMGIGNPLVDPQQQQPQQQLQPQNSNNNGQQQQLQQMGVNQMGRLDNQNLTGQMNVNTSMGQAISNQMGGMSGGVGVNVSMAGLLQQQQSPLLQQQQAQNQQQQLIQQQMQNQQSGFVSTSTVPTSSLDLHQQQQQQAQNQFTMANNNQSTQQQQLQQPFAPGSDPMMGMVPSSGSSGDWNSNLTMSGQTVQCSTNSMSPLPTSNDQQFGLAGQLQQQQQPYQQQMNNTFNQLNQQQQRQLGSESSMMNVQQQQQPGMQGQMGMSGLQQQGQQQSQQNQLQQQQQASLHNQLLGQDPTCMTNQQLQFQKNQQQLPFVQQETGTGHLVTGTGMQTSHNAQLQMQQIQANQQQQPYSQLGQQQQQQPQQQLGQHGSLGIMGGQQGQLGSITTSQSSHSLQNQLSTGLNIATSVAGSQAGQWPQSSPSQMYDQNGRLISNTSQFAQGSQQQQQHQQHQQQQQSLQSMMGINTSTHQQSQLVNMQNQQYSQQQLLQLQQQQQQSQHLNQQHGQHNLGMNAAGSAQVPTSKTSSIGGLLADFSRALGLGTSPRPSPSEDKSEPFPVPSSGVGASGTSAHGQSYDPYNPAHQHQNVGGQQHHGLASGQQVQQSAFTPIHEGSLAYLQRQQQQHSQSYLQQHQQPSQSALQASLGGIQSLQYGSGIGLASSSQLLSSSATQQYPTTLLSSQGQQQPTQVLTQGGLLAQQQSSGLSVGVVGALSPAQAHMYQQQMALQHQQQHLKKTSRRAHLSSGGDLRRDGTTSTVLIGGQQLAVTPGGMAIGALTPAVVTSLGTFIGGSPAVLGTSLLQQPIAVTPLGTPIGTPVGTPRSGRDPGAGDSSDTMSETDSQKSLRMRRKLPCLPPDQEAAPLPSTKKRERHRSQEFRSLSPMRLSSMDGTVPGRSYPLSSLTLSRPSASESNLRKLTMGADPIPRPGSALGCLQASSVISSVGGKQDSIYPLGGNILSSSPAFAGMALRTTTSGLTSDLTTTTSVLSGLYPSYKQSQDSWSSNLAELAAALPPDLRHLLNKGSVGGLSDHDLSGLSGLTSSLGDTSLNVGSHLPSYMRTLREQLQEERRQLLSEERRRLEALRERDRELGARLDAVTSRAGSEALRSRADLSRNGGPPSAGASPLLNRKLKGHRRQLSDPKLSLPFSPIQEDGDSELQDFDRVSTGLLRPPYKSFEYESLEDSALLQRPATAHGQIGGDWDHSQSYLASSWAAAGGALRETAITSIGGVHEDDEIRNRMSTSRMLSRRSSDGEAWPSTSSVITRSPSSTREKRHTVRKHRKSRSWHPSPYVSEEEDEEEEDSLSREEKKARIKAEIARRRQQIQERAGFHGDIHVSRLQGPGVSDHERHSVLKSVDQLLRDQYGRYDTYGGRATLSAASLYHVPSPGGYASGAIASSNRPSSHHHHTHHHHHSPTAHHPHHHLPGRIMPGGHIIISPSAEDRSMERLASTFRTDHDYASLLYSERYGEMMSPLATDSESMGSELGAPAAMPLLPDMPTRSRRLLEDLGSAPIGLTEGPSTRSGGPHATAGQSLKGRFITSEPVEPAVAAAPLGTPHLEGFYEENIEMAVLPVDSQPPKCRLLPSTKNLTKRAQRDSIISQGDSSSAESSRRSSRSRSLVPVVLQNEEEGEQGRSPQQEIEPLPPPPSQHPPEKRKESQSSQRKRKYSYPVKRYLLSRDPKDKSVGGNGVGMKVVGGKEVPDLGGKLVAYVAQIFPGGLVETIGEIQEGDVIVEWNGKYLGNKTFEEVTSILRGSLNKQEFEILIRRDLNVKTGKVYFLGSTDDLRRQSDCGTEAGSGITDSQSVGHGQQDTTDDNVSDQSRPAEGIYSSSGTVASECNSSAAMKALHHVDDSDAIQILGSSDQGFQKGASPINTLCIPNFEDSNDGKIIRRHSALAGTTISSELKPDAKNKWLQQRRSLGYDVNRPPGSIVMPQYPPPQSDKHSERERRSISITNQIKEIDKRKEAVNGYIYLQICHDPKANILYVTVLRAKLPKQRNEDGTDHVPVDPYIICSLYPEKIIENQRRTRHVPMCSDPEFNQTMVYPQIDIKDLNGKTLEVCAWNYNPMGEDELFGKVILSLSEQGILDEQPHCYPLKIVETSQRKSSDAVMLKRKSSSTFISNSLNSKSDSEDQSQKTKNSKSKRCPLFTLTD